MDKNNLLVTVAVISILTSLFLSLFLVTVKTEHKISNRLFAFFLILTAIDVVGNLSHLFDLSNNLRVFISSLSFLQLPTFYLYILSVCYADFKLQPKHLLHAVPFLAANFILIPRFYSVSESAKLKFLENSSSMLEIQFNHIFIHVQILLYIVAAFLLLSKAKKIYLENYAGASIESLKWLFQFTLALSIFFFIALIKNAFKFTAYPYISGWIKIGLLVFELAIVFWYLYKALNHPNLFRKIDSKLKLVKNIIAEQKISQQPIENRYSQELLILKKYMVEQKPFLNPSLTIQDISKEVKIPTRELSLLINHTLGQHFFDFVNTYRIENAIILLKDATKNRVTILEILYEVGFNSKSSFNTAFKKHTGTTPTLYRKSL